MSGGELQIGFFFKNNKRMTMTQRTKTDVHCHILKIKDVMNNTVNYICLFTAKPLHLFIPLHKDVSVFLWLARRRQRWSCSDISSGTSSLMMGGQRSSLLSHSPLTALTKSPSSSVLTPPPNLFHFHPPLHIYLHTLIHMFSFTSSKKPHFSSPPSLLFLLPLSLPALPSSVLSYYLSSPFTQRQGREGTKGPWCLPGEVIKQKSNCISALWALPGEAVPNVDSLSDRIFKIIITL